MGGLSPHQMLHGRRQLVLLRCMVNSENERNPFNYLLIFAGEIGVKCTIIVLPLSGGGRWGSRQIVMAFMDRATHVLQWPLQCFASW